MRGKRFKHLKTGKNYIVLDQGLCTTNAYDGADLVIYIDANEEFALDRTLFVRDKEEFLTKFKSCIS